MLITEYFEQHGIRYWEAGSKNVGKNHIGIQCVFCSDSSNHLGVQTRTGSFKCLKCGERGNIRKLLLKLGESSRSVNALLKILSFEDMPKERKEHVPTSELTKLMEDFHSPLFQEHREYLENRGYDADLWQKRYGLLSADHCGKYKFRIIIPVIMKKKMVGFIGRDVTGRSELKYKTSPDPYNPVARRRWLFGIDRIRDKQAIVVEGPTDAMNLGDGAIATFSTSFSNEQVEQIAKLGLKKCFIMFDGEPEAIRQAYDLSYKLSPFIDHVEVIEMPDGKDPGDMNQQDVKELRREIFT